jgi:TRAP-type C4-dicarboxylate transport system permease large subunit
MMMMMMMMLQIDETVVKQNVKEKTWKNWKSRNKHVHKCKFRVLLLILLQMELIFGVISTAEE